MPYSLVLNIIPLSSISPKYLEGRHLNALFLQVVNSVAPDLAQYFHDSQINKSFTISTLQTSTKNEFLHSYHSQSIPQNKSCWWRISLLDDSIFHQLTKLWLNLNPQKPWHLGNADLYITSILGTPRNEQPWANACTYQQLYEQASETERLFKFTFATPTAFRQGKYDTSLPTPESVFNSLLKRWQKYSNIEFMELPINQIYPSFFDIRTEIMSDKHGRFIGCIGNIHYRLFGDISSIQIKQLNALADFAIYCGVGRKTTMGMGMVRRV